MPIPCSLLCRNSEIERILHSWKSYTSIEANKYLQRTGPFWIHESFDRFIRNDEHVLNEISDIEQNPVSRDYARLRKSGVGVVLAMISIVMWVFNRQQR